MGTLESYKISESDNIALKEKINDLLFINGVAIYYDSNATERRINSGYICRWENNYSLVTENGLFLTETIGMLLPRFYYRISINEYGLFYLINQRHSHNSPEKPLFSAKIFDCDGNYMEPKVFDTLIKILTSRKLHSGYTPDSFIEMPEDIKNGRFKITNKFTLWEEEKSGSCDLQFGQERKDGLFLYTEKHEYRNSGDYSEWQYVKDENGISMSLDGFYHGLLMLQNGKEYWNHLLPNILAK